MKTPVPIPPPHFALAAYVRELIYEYRGREVRGTRHFAPGALVYVGRPYSGDGWERTFITGPVRGSGRYISLMGPRSRLVHPHRRWVDDPVVLEALTWSPSGWWTEDGSVPELLSRFSEDPLADTRETGWEDGEWERLTARLLVPERPRLVAGVATVLDVPPATAEALLAEGDAGRALRNLFRGRPGPQGATPLRSARAAWRVLAPAAWREDGSGRRFLMPHGEALATPETPLDVVCACADVEGLEAAEALARELAAVCGVTGPVRIVWRVASRTEVYRHAGSYPHAPPVREGPDRLEVLSQVLAWAARAIVGANVRWRSDAEDIVARHGAPPAEAFRLLCALLGTGYALERLSPGRVVLLCPALPSA